jgi:hypothetical protein
VYPMKSGFRRYRSSAVSVNSLNCYSSLPAAPFGLDFPAPIAAPMGQANHGISQPSSIHRRFTVELLWGCHFMLDRLN